VGEVGEMGGMGGMGGKQGEVAGMWRDCGGSVYKRGVRRSTIARWTLRSSLQCGPDLR
jgi:hypothetical protein